MHAWCTQLFQFEQSVNNLFLVRPMFLSVSFILVSLTRQLASAIATEDNLDDSRPLIIELLSECLCQNEHAP